MTTGRFQRKEERPRGRRERQPPFCRGRFAAGADGMSVARSSGAVREVERRLPAFPMRCRMTRTLSARLRTARLSGRPGRRPSQGGGTSKQGTGCSGGGLTSKTVAVADAPGHLVRFVPLPGRARGLAGNAGPTRGPRVRGSDWRQGTGRGLACRGDGEAGRRDVMAVMQSRRNRLVPRDRDGEMCKWRHWVGNFLAKTGEFRAIATSATRPA